MSNDTMRREELLALADERNTKQMHRLINTALAALDRAEAAERELSRAHSLIGHVGVTAGGAELVKSAVAEMRANADEYGEPPTLPEPSPAPAPANTVRVRAAVAGEPLTFDAFRAANIARCIKWHPAGIESWSPSDWLTAVTGELGELASLIKMRNRERDGLVGNKFSPTDQQMADEAADVLTYLDLLAYVLGVDLGRAAAEKFNRISERNGFPDRLPAAPATIEATVSKEGDSHGE
jgi:NTP pyrophosphatase (non-canonical NTP hydrolase)